MVKHMDVVVGIIFQHEKPGGTPKRRQILLNYNELKYHPQNHGLVHYLLTKTLTILKNPCALFLPCIFSPQESSF